MTLPPNTALSAENVGLLKAGDVVRRRDGRLCVVNAEQKPDDSLVCYSFFDDRSEIYYGDPPFYTYIGPDLGDGWIGWSGGECPVQGRADVNHQNGSITEDVDVVRALWWWRHEDPEDGLNIIAFRPALSPPAEGTFVPTDSATQVQMAAIIAHRDGRDLSDVMAETRALKSTPTPAQPDTGDVAALREALDDVLKTSGARGSYSAMKYGDAVEKAERILAALSKPNAQGAPEDGGAE